MYSDSARSGRTLQALRIAAAWAENTVTWGNQPATTGSAATTRSGQGVRSWNVTSQVQAMYTLGQSHGLLIRDASESGSGAEQSFHGKEKGDNVPVLVLRFVGSS